MNNLLIMRNNNNNNNQDMNQLRQLIIINTLVCVSLVYLAENYSLEMILTHKVKQLAAS